MNWYTGKDELRLADLLKNTIVKGFPLSTTPLRRSGRPICATIHNYGDIIRGGNVNIRHTHNYKRQYGPYVVWYVSMGPPCGLIKQSYELTLPSFTWLNEHSWWKCCTCTNTVKSLVRLVSLGVFYRARWWCYITWCQHLEHVIWVAHWTNSAPISWLYKRLLCPAKYGRDCVKSHEGAQCCWQSTGWLESLLGNTHYGDVF